MAERRADDVATLAGSGRAPHLAPDPATPVADPASLPTSARVAVIPAPFRLLALALLAGGCASAAGGPGSAEAPPTVLRWQGAFQPQQQQTGTVAATGTNRLYGNVTLTPGDQGANYSRIQLTLSATETSVQYRWAALPGRCGTPSLPLLAYDQFPPLEVTSSGRASLDHQLPLTFPTSGAYHVNVFRPGGYDRAYVVACANLRAA
jgi:hypothetical protein